MKLATVMVQSWPFSKTLVGSKGISALYGYIKLDARSIPASTFSMIANMAAFSSSLRIPLLSPLVASENLLVEPLD